MKKKVGQKTLKILAIFTILLIICAVFILRLFYINYSHKPKTSTIVSKSKKLLRGNIISKDGFILATSINSYKVKYNPINIAKYKKDTFATLFSLYSNQSFTSIRNKLNTNKNTVFAEIKDNKYSDFKKLQKTMDNLGVYKTTKNNIRQGLSFIQKEERVFMYEDLFSPYLGYLQKDSFLAIKGIEKKYNQELTSKKIYAIRGQRDVSFNYLLNGNMEKTKKEEAKDVFLNISVAIQIHLEQLLSVYKHKLLADEIIASVMDSKTGKIVAIASSNRFNPELIKQDDIPSLNINAIEYSFEPGSVLKPITLSFLMELNKVKKSDIFNGHEGVFKLGQRTIRDDHPFKWVSAENAIVFSSNIVLAQFGILLEPKFFYHGLDKFGFGNYSGINLGLESKGIVPSVKGLNIKARRATVAYGYGIRATFIQILKAYNVFNNNGLFLEPKVVSHIKDKQNNILNIKYKKNKQILSSKTTKKIKNILIKTVQEGTGRGAIIDGFEIGGKTGTARTFQDGEYIKEYISSFFGFANGKNNKYTIGVTVFRPSSSFYASQTAVPIFKNIVNILDKNNFIQKRN